MVPCNGFTFSMVYFPVDGIRKCWPPSAWYAIIPSLRLYLSLFSCLEYSEIRNSSSVATVEMFSTGQLTARAC